MFRIYIWMDGENFDAETFQNSLDDSLRGTVDTRKRVIKGRVERFAPYWMSEVCTPALHDIEGEFIRLLSRYRTAILRARASHATRIVVEIVAEFASVDDMRGFYLPPDVLRLLSEMGAAVDVDIVPKISSG